MARTTPYIVILAAASAAILPIAFMGIPDSVDLMQHLRFADLYREAIVTGNFSPGWAANDNFGFGSIGVRYYPPLAYMVLALAKLSTGSWFHSFWITTLGWMFLGGSSVYLWVREWATRSQALAAGVMYVIVPYHTFQIYQAVLYSEFAAAGILPFCFLFLFRICRYGRWLDVLLFSAAYSCLILTHIPSTIIASISLAVYGFFLIEWRRFYETVSKIAAALIISLMATAFHLVRAIPELKWVMHNSPKYFASGAYDYKRYLFPNYFSSTATRFVGGTLSNFDILIILTLLLFIPSLLLLLLRAKNAPSPSDPPAKIELAANVTGVFAIFMLSIASVAIWDQLPILQKVQFPWRWLLVASLMGSAAFIAAISGLASLERVNKRLIVYPAVALVLVLALYDVTQSVIPSAPLPHDVFDQKVAKMYDEEACDCWWPVWAKHEALDQRTQVDAGSRDVAIANWQSEFREFTIGAGQSRDVRVATFFHPYWRANVNGAGEAVRHDDNGVILIGVPDERSEVRLYFEEPGYIYAAKLVSMLTWLGIGVLLIVAYRTRH